ncbi:hypothetical protein A6411_23885 [Prescottella equi]|uniref:hypothetical protein n=1 Tax=Rhodococcus hoagii TaxID=43767 RepID=UPI0009BF00F0|nr:hypothetical protein [Prescottella equi]OQQ23354.1 hypothetical protein A6411_23885 [Prescottella equi]
MSTGIYLEVDGKPVPARELVWEMTAPCGCACAWTTVRQDSLTEDQAWRSMATSAAMVKRDKKRGFTTTLVLRSDSRIKEGVCEHSPQWGVQPKPMPDGYTWAASAHAKAKATHLVPLVIERESESPFGDEVSAICGRSASRQWSTQWWCIDGLIECADCWKKGGAL